MIQYGRDSAVHTICHIITKLELGGAQEVALFTVAHLDRTRFWPVLVCGPGGLLTQEAKALPGVEVVIIPALCREIRPFQDAKALIMLVRLLCRLRPSVVHTHSSKAGILGRWAAWLAGVPVTVHTIHGYGITPTQSAWLRRLLIASERFIGLVTTHWIAVSKADIEAGLRWRLFPRDKVALIRPGIDPRPFRASLSRVDRDQLRAELGVGTEEFLVGTVACLKPQKAPQDFVSVAALVCSRIPSARFVLVGDGELRHAVEEQIRHARLEKRVRIIGWRRDVPALMQAFDTFLLTSHWEGLPRVLLEARISRLPVVATRVGGVAEAIVEGSHGWLCEASDVQGLADQICQILTDRDHRELLRRNGGVLPIEFDIDEMVKQYEQLYAGLLTDRKRAVGSDAFQENKSIS